MILRNWRGQQSKYFFKILLKYGIYTRSIKQKLLTLQQLFTQPASLRDILPFSILTTAKNFVAALQCKPKIF